MRAGFKKFFVRSVPETIIIIFGAVIAIILMLFVASFFIDRPLRGYLEKTMNSKLKGYHVSLPGAHFQIIGFSLTLKDLKIRQNEHPDPPVAYIPSLTASVQWRELLSGQLVADFEFDKPQAHLDLKQLRTESKRPTKVKNEGWQQAFESIYPLDINSVRFIDGDIVYVDVDEKMPLHVKHLNFESNNIRNIHSRESAYPSPVHAEAVIFGTGNGTIDGVKIDYLHMPQTAEAEAARAEKVKKAAKKAGNKPEMLLKPDEMKLTHSELGYVNMAKSPGYRVFMSDADLTVRNLSNQSTEGVSDISLTGLFMGNGKTSATAAFRPSKAGPDFDLKLEIKNTDLTSMNDVLLAYGKFDVVHGFFSLFVDLHVKNREIKGYIKPLFTNMKVYDKRKDADKSLFRKLYYKLVGGIAKILENPRSSVATKVEVSGTAGSTKASTFQAIITLFQNAFFHMILPGFDKSLRSEEEQSRAGYNAPYAGIDYNYGFPGREFQLTSRLDGALARIIIYSAPGKGL